MDDGSNQTQREAAKQIIATYDNVAITFKSKANGGVSSSKNVGLEISSGEYVWFIDSDDYLSMNWSSDVFQAIKNVKADLFVVPFKMLSEEGEGLVPWLANDAPAGFYYDGTYLEIWRNLGNNYNYIFKSSMLKNAGLNSTRVFFRRGCNFQCGSVFEN